MEALTVQALLLLGGGGWALTQPSSPFQTWLLQSKELGEEVRLPPTPPSAPKWTTVTSPEATETGLSPATLILLLSIEKGFESPQPGGVCEG